jgi:hypothetical protein
MTPTRRGALCLAAAALLGLPGTAAVRAAEDQQAPAAGTLIIEPIRSGPVIAPDFKITDIEGSTEVLFGGWGGYLHDETWFVGAAGYWLPDTDEGLEMSYGGLVVGWRAPAMGRVRFGARGLVGGGWATVPLTGAWPMPYDGRHTGRPGSGWMPPSGGYFWGWYSDGFFVAEPQLDVIVHLAPWASLTGGMSYRWTNGDDILDDRLNGVAGSIALQFGVF